MDSTHLTVVQPPVPAQISAPPSDLITRRRYWQMVFVAAGLASDPWEPAVLLDQDKKFCGRLPIPDAAALVEGTWDSLRHAEQDIEER